MKKDNNINSRINIILGPISNKSLSLGIIIGIVLTITFFLYCYSIRYYTESRQYVQSILCNIPDSIIVTTETDSSLYDVQLLNANEATVPCYLDTIYIHGNHLIFKTGTDEIVREQHNLFSTVISSLFSPYQ